MTEHEVDIESIPLDPELRGWLLELASERRFGERDRLGTVNLIDGAARFRAAESVQTGEPVNLGRLLAPYPSLRHDGRPGFSLDVYYTHAPIGVGSDHVELDCHGPTNTHIDALNHLAVDGTWYCGWPVDDPQGPSVLELTDHGLFTRGVFVDVPAVRGTSWVDADDPISEVDIEAALAAAGVEFMPGDALLLSGGRDRWEAAGNEYLAELGEVSYPGLGRRGAEWVTDNGVSLLCWDFADAIHPDEPLYGSHLLLWAIGQVLVDGCDYARARLAFAAAGKATCALAISPLRIAGATGCTVNPMIIL
jgi:kynurenine formamidase